MIQVSRTIRTLDNIFQTSGCHSNLDSKVFLASMLLCSNCSGTACNKLKSGWIWMVYDGMTSTMSNMYITEKHVVHAGVTSHSSKKKNTKRASHINVPFSILFSTFVYLHIFQQIAPFFRALIALIVPQAGPVCFLDPARTLPPKFSQTGQSHCNFRVWSGNKTSYKNNPRKSTKHTLTKS